MKTTTWRVRLMLSALAGSLMSGPVLADRPDFAGGGRGHGGDFGDGRGHDTRGGPPRSGYDNGDRRQYDTRDTRGDGPHGRSYSASGWAPGPGGAYRFAPEHHGVVRDYYAGTIRAGHCPPGLMKKHNGCLPPGQARRWAIGRPLPREVVYYDVPPALVVRLGRPPAGYRYVRAGADILLIAVGSMMVVDAIEDLGNL
jgi:hypothetical protein